MKKVRVKFVVEYEIHFDQERTSLAQAKRFVKNQISDHGVNGWSSEGIFYEPTGKATALIRRSRS